MKRKEDQKSDWTKKDFVLCFSSYSKVKGQREKSLKFSMRKLKENLNIRLNQSF